MAGVGRGWMWLDGVWSDQDKRKCLKMLEKQRKLEVWRRLEKVGVSWNRSGLAESAEAVLSASRADCICFVLLTQLSPQGAGRIQSLRAFRRA